MGISRSRVREREREMGAAGKARVGQMKVKLALECHLLLLGAKGQALSRMTERVCLSVCMCMCVQLISYSACREEIL
jgi:hypothetical protein